MVLLLSATFDLIVASAAETNDLQLFAKVIGFTGASRYTTNDSIWTPTRTGDQLGLGAIVQTGAWDSGTEVAIGAPDGGGPAIIHVCSNSAVRLEKFGIKDSHPQKVRHIKLVLLTGRLWVSLDGASRYEIELQGTTNLRLVVPPKGSTLQETAFAFMSPATITVTKGAISTSNGAGPERTVRAGEQLGSGDAEIRTLPPDSVELRLER